MRLPPALKRYTQWIGFTAVLIPLLVLLALQYRSLARLDQTATLVHKAGLNNFLEAVTTDVDYFYRTNAERVLDLPAAVFTQDQLAKAAFHFKKKGVEGVKRLFVERFQNEDDHPLYFNPSCATFQPPLWSPELRAVYVASSPWRILANKGGRLERVRLMVEEKDPDYRILLYPITDDSSRVVGVAGMVLDEDYFRDHVLPEAVKQSLATFDSSDMEPIVSVADAKGRIVYTNGPLPGRRMEVQKPFSLVFTDWTIGLASRHTTPAVVARRNFLLNVGLSAALATVLVGGVLLALRTASREMKLSRMKNEFVSNVSHELRTPLASIRVFAEFLRLGRVDGPEKAREYGEYIETESRRLTQLVNNILDFASIESGRKTYHFERCDVREVVCGTLKTFGVRLRQSGFDIVLQGAETPLPPARIDAGAIAQSLSNLLDNAVKYSNLKSANGKTDITVSLRRDGDWIVISVIDQGIGIPRDEQRKIFDRFHRVSTGLVHDVKGSGLGLSIVRHIVDAHRGRVTVESRPGEGSTFSIHLPIDSPNAPDTQPLAAPAEARERPSEA
ncbi:MAG: two-component system, OmpR family, phosphate regulon sensor histidine kinase PhoR [Acidobacteriota bacterium]|jgi:signal transduction histidine kinase|nr:two-component system, OmpR family, phosphate regulon sensor histidine kinase PhoR [Acidobacteriota bacterium]